LAAVAFADVAGWSRLIEKNDVETLRAWKALRSDVIEPLTRGHGGRLLEIAGDSVLVEFPSAVAAVSWALDVERQSRATAQKGEAVDLKLRFGVNVEDVIVDGEKLVGDGVNIASRLHQLAAPGELIVTATVREYVGNKLPVRFIDLGVRKLKNISRRLQLYRVEARGEAAGEADDERELQPTNQETVYRDSRVEQSVRTLLAVELAEPAERHNGTTASRWQKVLDGVASDVLPMHGGRLVKNLEHGLLLGFSRVPHAANAAFDIQRLCESVNSGVPQARQLLARMGMQVGELIADDEEVYGGERNLAGRLTTLAGPGEIVVSAGVRDQLTPVLDADIEDLGDCYLKALTRPVRAYRVGPPGPRPVIESTGLAGELRPTIAVIPFTARGGGEPEHQVLGEVLADEVISALSRTSDMNVISRLSTTAFRGRDATLQEVSALLHADYIVSGAYYVHGTKFSLIAELADPKSGRAVWTDDVKGDVASLVSGKDEVIDRLVVKVCAAVTARELQKAQIQPLPTLESYTLLIGAISLMHRLSPHDFDRAGALLEALIERAPRRAIPHAWLAKWHVLRVWQGWAGSPLGPWAAEKKLDAQLALDCTKRALDSDPNCSLALAIDGLIHTNLLKQFDIALQRYDLAISVNPNDSLAFLLKGTLHAFKGEGKQAMRDTQRALRLSPLDPHRYFYDSLAATAALSAGRYDRAIELAQRSLRANRMHASSLRALAISQWLSERHADARSTVAELMKIESKLTVENYLERHPAADHETGRLWAEALGKAGVPQGK
jgi:class 3 adenylate cyclase/TolB-like protein/tetratricopeptide (TPR) repeat protein